MGVPLVKHRNLGLIREYLGSDGTSLTNMIDSNVTSIDTDNCVRSR